MNKREIRAGVPAEIRADDDGIKVSGHAAVFNKETVIGDYFREVILPGAFTEAIGRDDIVFVINHMGLPLARSTAGKGTLDLSEDERGLHMATTLDADDPDVKSIVPKMERGDLNEMSFAFWPTVQEWDDSGDMPLRTIKKAELFDVSIVTRAQYDGTDIGLRSVEGAMQSLKQHRESIRKETNFNSARKRVQLKGHLALKEREKG